MNKPTFSVLLFSLAASLAMLGCGRVAEQTTSQQISEAAAYSTEGEWPLFRGNSLATGVAESGLPQQMELLWTFESKAHGFEASAVIKDGLVFVGCQDGNFYVLSLETGEEKWHYETPLGFAAAAAVADGRVVTGDVDGKVYCFEAETGKPLWGFEATAEVNSAPNFYKDKVLVCSQDGTLYCLNAATGELAWKHTIDAQVRCSPTVVEDRVFLAGCDAAEVHIINLEDGKKIASVETEAQAMSTPAAGGDRIYFGTQSGAFYALDWKQAKIAWMYKSQKPNEIKSSAALTDEIIVFGSNDKLIHAIARDDARPLWTFATKAKVESSPVVVGNRVFAAGHDGRVYGLDLRTGKKVWEYEAGGHFLASPAVAEGKLVIGNDAGKLYCFGAKK